MSETIDLCWCDDGQHWTSRPMETPRCCVACQVALERSLGTYWDAGIPAQVIP